MTEPSVEILLSEDHESIDGLYDRYLAIKKESPERALSAFRVYQAALLRHIRCEEELVFPVLDRFPDEIASQEVPTLREEHQVILPLLREVEAHLENGADPIFPERRLFEELHEHNAREEMRVYGPLDRLLNESEKRRAAEALRAPSPE